MKDFLYKGKVGNLWLKGLSLVSSINQADYFETEEEVIQRINRLQRKGLVSEKKPIRIVKVEDLLEDNSIPKAYAWADQFHKATGATRKHSGDPYIVHPEGVAELATAYGGTEDEIAAALLHDTLEDTDLTAEEMEAEFGPEVAQIVQEITNEKSEVKRLGKEGYINKELEILSPSALFVKLCDMLYNTLDYPTSSQKERMYNNITYLLDHRTDLDERCLELCEAILGA